MSNNADFINIQRRLMNILENGPNMQPDQLERALDGLVGATRQAVRQQPRYVVTPPSSPPPARARTPEGPPPMRTEPQFIELRGPFTTVRPDAELRPAAELRPTAELRPAVRPSVLIREMRAQMGWTARFEAPIVPLAPIRGNISWATYSMLCMKKRAIGKARYEAECKETCAICLDKHTNGESVLTEECKHCFGKECWKNWISNPSGNQKCPTCREECPTVLSYTLRAERRPRANAIVEVEDLTSIYEHEF
jgi:hypothetical protein